jgi:FkbM family methyltransferase
MLERFHIPITDAEEREILRYAFSESLFKKLGATVVDSIDASGYEGASIIHDFNEPIDTSLVRAYTCMVDFGSLEHVFNTPVALKNCTDLLEVGGYFISVSIANNFMGHGFYQFSPELFFNYFAHNGFTQIEVFLMPFRAVPYLFRVANPGDFQGRVELVNAEPVCIGVIAKKIKHLDKARYPIQSDYRDNFWRGQDVNRNTQPSKSDARIALAVKDLRAHVASLISWPETISPELAYGFENSLHYQVIDPAEYSPPSNEPRLRKIASIEFKRNVAAMRKLLTKPGTWLRKAAGDPPQQTASGTAQEVAGGAPQEVAGGTPQELAGGTAEEVAGGTAQELADGMAQEVADATPQEMAGSTPQEVTGDVLQLAASLTIDGIQCFENQGVYIPVIEGIFSKDIAESVATGRYESHEASVLKTLIQGGEVILEIGAGCGFISTYCAKNPHTKEVFCVEANPNLIEAIKLTHRINDVNVTVFNEILAKDEGETEFYVNNSFWASGTHSFLGAPIRVKTTSFQARLDQIRPSMLIVDIEGGEEKLFESVNLKGVTKIMLELHQPTIGRRGIKKVFDLLAAQDFHYDVWHSYYSVVTLSHIDRG